MHAKSLYLDLSARRISEHDLIDAIGSQCCTGLSSCRLKEGCIRFVAMACGFEISMDAFGAAGMQWQIAQFVAFAVNTQMQNTTAVMNVADLELAKLFAAQAVIQQHRQ